VRAVSIPLTTPIVTPPSSSSLSPSATLATSSISFDEKEHHVATASDNDSSSTTSSWLTSRRLYATNSTMNDVYESRQVTQRPHSSPTSNNGHYSHHGGGRSVAGFRGLRSRWNTTPPAGVNDPATAKARLLSLSSRYGSSETQRDPRGHQYRRSKASSFSSTISSTRNDDQMKSTQRYFAVGPSTESIAANLSSAVFVSDDHDDDEASRQPHDTTPPNVKVSMSSTVIRESSSPSRSNDQHSGVSVAAGLHEDEKSLPALDLDDSKCISSLNSKLDNDAKVEETKSKDSLVGWGPNVWVGLGDDAYSHLTISQWQSLPVRHRLVLPASLLRFVYDTSPILPDNTPTPSIVPPLQLPRTNSIPTNAPHDSSPGGGVKSVIDPRRGRQIVLAFLYLLGVGRRGRSHSPGDGITRRSCRQLDLLLLHWWTQLPLCEPVSPNGIKSSSSSPSSNNIVATSDPAVVAATTATIPLLPAQRMLTYGTWQQLGRCLKLRHTNHNGAVDFIDDIVFAAKDTIMRTTNGANDNKEANDDDIDSENECNDDKGGDRGHVDMNMFRHFVYYLLCLTLPSMTITSLY
jgi:hypothetical protein